MSRSPNFAFVCTVLNDPVWRAQLGLTFSDDRPPSGSVVLAPNDRIGVASGNSAFGKKPGKVAWQVSRSTRSPANGR